MGGPPPAYGGRASMHGGQRPISPQVLTKLSRPPSLCHQCTPVVFLGLINTCGNRNGCSLSLFAHTRNLQHSPCLVFSILSLPRGFRKNMPAKEHSASGKGYMVAKDEDGDVMQEVRHMHHNPPLMGERNFTWGVAGLHYPVTR